MCLLALPATLLAKADIYRWEIGVHGGGGYYLGELLPYKPQSAIDILAYGVHTRRKFDERWALQAKVMLQKVGTLSLIHI